jgi:hypothetical protein
MRFVDMNVLGQWIACEKMVYDGLEGNKAERVDSKAT